MTRGERPDDERLDDDRAEHLAPRRAERAQRRELARPLRDRDRERVRDHEAADEERDAAEREQELLQERDERVRVRRVLLSPARSPVRACAVGGRIARICCSSSASDTPGFAATAISSSLPALVEELLRGRQVEDRRAWRRRSSTTDAELDDARRCAAARPGPRPGRRSRRRRRSPSCRPSTCRSRPRSPPATRPRRASSGLNGESPFAMLKPRFGAPP